MGVAERRARDAERRRHERENLRRMILDAARELFVTEDYKAVSMRRIAERIEYSPAALYIHFKDKEEILDHLVGEGFTLLTSRLERLAMPDPVRRLQQGGHVYLEFALTQPHYYKLMFELPDSFQSGDVSAKLALGERCFGFIHSCVREAVRQGRFDLPQEQPHADLVASQTIWACLHGAASLTLAGRLKLLPAEAHPAFFEAVVSQTLAGFRDE